MVKSELKIKNKRKGIRKSNIITLTMSVAIILFANIIGSYVFTRLDLTAEKRYSLCPATKTLLRNLNDIVFFKVYLEGDMPAGFKKLRNETKEMLDEFRAYSSNIQYEFIDPSEGKDKKDLSKFYKQLVQKGLIPSNLQVKDKGSSTQQIIFPGALVTYKDKELPVQILMSQMGIAPEAVLNSSVQSLEYNLANVIRKLTTIAKPKIGFIEGHGELGRYETADIGSELSEYYAVDRLKINHKLKALKGYKMIIIAKPDSAFDSKDKFIIDQFIMKGGKVLWLVDPVFASMDSLQKSNETIGIANQLNLDDQLFAYGVRLNFDLLLDLNAVPIPVKTGSMGNQPKFEFKPWYFSPLIMPAVKHVIVNNLNAIKTEFVSSIDTLKIPGIKKTVLLSTSKYTKIKQTPANISLDILRNQPDEREYNKQFIPVAVLLEGKFQSLFKYQWIPPEIKENKEIDFKDQSVPNKMIVISDGDIIKNQVQYSNGDKYPMPLGYDKYTGETFGNKDFLLNCIDYLSDESGLISVRSRELKIRLLDKTKITDGRLKIQIINTVSPIVIIILFGIGRSIYRKRKWTKEIK